MNKDFKYELDTPCLTIDIDILERNLANMQAAARAADKNLRPHAKTHKCSLLAKKQIEAGAIGACAAKVSEAEVLTEAGVQGILITGSVAVSKALMASIPSPADQVARLKKENRKLRSGSNPKQPSRL